MSEMTHERVLEVLSEYLAGHLAEAERVEVVRHLKECEACAQELALRRKASSASSATRRRGPSEGGVDRPATRPEDRDEGPPIATRPAGEGAGRPGSPATPSSETRATRPRNLEAPWLRRLLAAVAVLAVVAWGGSRLRSGTVPRADGRAGMLLVAGRSEVLVLRGGRTMRPDRVEALQVDDTVSTGADSVAVLALGAGSSLRLGPETRLRMVQREGIDLGLGLSQGILRVSEGKDLRVSVSTPEARIRPLGTTFDVRTGEERTVVTVLDGRVDVRSKQGVVVAVAGERALADAAGARVEIVGPEAARDSWALWNGGLVIPSPAVGEALPSAPPLGRSPARIPAPESGGIPAPATGIPGGATAFPEPGASPEAGAGPARRAPLPWSLRDPSPPSTPGRVPGGPGNPVPPPVPEGQR